MSIVEKKLHALTRLVTELSRIKNYIRRIVVFTFRFVVFMLSFLTVSVFSNVALCVNNKSETPSSASYI